MAVIAPQTDLYLIKSPLEMDEVNQLTFSNANAQYNYFASLPKISVDDFTYQRKDSTIRYGGNFDELIGYNYCMYRNDAFSNKWFYAYITGMEYLNDSVTAITIKTDVFQTWQFQLNYKPVFVEREHVNNDTAGIHTVPENLELGEYEIVDLRNSPLFESGEATADWIPCFCVTKFPDDVNNLGSDGNVQNSNGLIGGVMTSLHFFATHTIEAGIKVIEAYNREGHGTTSDAIVNIYMIPRCCVNDPPSGNTSLLGYALYGIKNFFTSDSFILQQPQVLAENYQPVNKKLLTYPFSYFYVSNNAGQNITYHYEDFPIDTIDGNTARTIMYKKSIVPSASLSAKLYFINYKGFNEGSGYGSKLYEYGISYGKVPICAWTTDYYTNWLTQNAVNTNVSLATGVASGLLGIATSAATGNIAGAVGGLIGVGSSIGNTLGAIQRAETTPPQANGDINTGDFGYAFLRNSISFYQMSIRPEMARIIDQYFSAYGYKVNLIKLPNITGRRNWNYVKTVGCYIDGDVPQADLEEIKNMFNNGVTFWHNPATFADYSQNNDII